MFQKILDLVLTIVTKYKASTPSVYRSHWLIYLGLGQETMPSLYSIKKQTNAKP